MIEIEENRHLIGLKQGNLNSFKWLYRFYYEKVYYFCFFSTKSPLDAEEITSDVFVKIWEKRAIIDSSLPLKPLLLKITRDFTWNYLKRTARKKELQELFLQNYSRALVHEEESEMIFKEYMNMVDQALIKLTPQQQRIFTLWYRKGKNLNQIAEKLNISKNTVKVHLANSKRFILDYLRLYADIA